MTSDNGLSMHKASQHLILPTDERVLAFIPHAKTGDGKIAVPHRREETRILRNLGYNAPSPILWHYEWPGLDDPFESQKKTAALLSMNNRAYVLNTMGTGKTRSALFAADFLMQTNCIKKVLIVAPLSTLNATWLQELKAVFPHRRGVVVHHSTRKRRLKLLDSEADFYIINHDGVKTIPDELMRKRFDCIILDELAVYRNQGTELWKSTRELVKNTGFLWGLTGAPTPNAPTDAFAQAKLIRPDTVTYFSRFRDETMFKVDNFKWVAKKTANDSVYALLQPSVRYKLEDCIDIPETTTTFRSVALSPKQLKVYKGVNSAFAAEMDGKIVSAANEAVKMNKLLQIACGYVYTNSGDSVSLSPNSRLEELNEVIEESDRKVIVFVPFKNAIREIERYLVGKKHTVDIVYSAVSRAKRDEIFHRFQTDKQKTVLVAHPKTMSHGLTLTAATTIVWYGATASLDTYIQANARIARPGQTNKTSIVHLQSTPIEDRVYSRLMEKKSTQGALLEMFDGVNDKTKLRA